jgi:serine/threonine-protein kinase
VDAERWRRLQELFEGASRVAPDGRRAFLVQACPDDPALRSQVTSLLFHAEDTGPAGAVLDGAAGEAALDSPIGERLGAYRVTEKLGEGGMGAVYLAVRDDQEFQKRVAVKVLRPGLHGTPFLARFRTERQILAQLDHPGIARVLDAGTTERGMPYLVMEHVDGVPITSSCDARRLATRERVRLFREVCAAVQYAHRNLVVHRDLKPSNILVDGEGRPKLLDFGIAKLLQAGPELATVAATRTNVRLMTPEYASPEQVRGQPVTTASDVYSLGVVLYELLTGRRPHRLLMLSPVEMERRVLEEEPVKPSTAVRRPEERFGADGRVRTLTAEEVGRELGASPDLLRRQLAGDLDTIVLKALQKDPARRYASVEQLDEDLRRYLEGLPVLARRDSATYRLGKFASRHRWGVASAAAFLLLLVGFGVAMSVQAVRLARERNKALAAEREAREVSAFLTGLFSIANPSESRGATVTAREILDSGAARVGSELAGQPQVQASLARTMGSAYKGLGLNARARELYTTALETRRRTLGAEHAATAESLSDLGDALREASDFATAERLHRQALEIRTRLLGPDHAEVGQSLNNLALTLQELGRYDEAEPLYRRALEVRRRALEPRHPEVAITLSNLGQLLKERGRFAEAEPVYREVLAYRREALGHDHPSTLNSLHVLSTLLAEVGRHEEAEAGLRECLALRRRVLGDDHPDLTNTMNSLASLLQDQGAYAEAEALYRESLARRRRVLGLEHLDVAVSVNNLASLLEERGSLAEAEALYRESLALRRRRVGDEHPAVARALNNVGRVLVAEGRLAEAEGLLRRALELRRARYGERHPDVASSLTALARLERARGRLGESERLWRESLELRRALLPAGHASVADSLLGLGEVLRLARRPEEAAPLLREALDGFRRALGPEHPNVARSELALGRCLQGLGREDEARRLLEAARTRLVSRLGPDHPEARMAMKELADTTHAASR